MPKLETLEDFCNQAISRNDRIAAAFRAGIAPEKIAAMFNIKPFVVQNVLGMYGLAQSADQGFYD